MDLTSFQQYGMAAIFIAACYKLYADNKDRERQIREDSIKREDKLMEHLDKVADTLKNIDERLCLVEKCIKKDGE